jgi:hypothetical protein
VPVHEPLGGKQRSVKVDEVAANSTRALNLVSVTEEEKYLNHIRAYETKRLMPCMVQ